MENFNYFIFGLFIGYFGDALIDFAKTLYREVRYAINNWHPK